MREKKRVTVRSLEEIFKMDERHEKHQSAKNDIVEVRNYIIEYLEKAIENLEEAGEKCEGLKMWYLVPGTPGNRIRDMIHRIRQIIDEINSVIPEPNRKEK